MSSNEIDSTAQAVQEVSVYEDACVTETTHLIQILSGLQNNLKMAKSAALLQESLHSIKEAEKHEEMEVYQHSFLAALETTKLTDLLDIDACVSTLRECADDLFYWTDLEADITDQKIKQLGSKAILDETLTVAAKTIASFNQSAKTLQEEFQRETSENNHQIAQKNKIFTEVQIPARENYLADQSAISELQQMNIKYQAGIRRIDTQKLQIAHALEIIQKIPELKTKAERQNARADLAVALHEVRLIDQRTGFNHFVNKCKRNVEALCQVRSSYLKQEDSTLRSFGKTLWKMAAFLVHLLPVPAIPADLPSFAYESVATTSELSEHITKPKVKAALRNRNSFSQPRPSPAKKVGTFFKKAASVLLGVGGLILAGLLCMTGFGIPKGLAIAAVSIEMLNTVKKGSDYFTESAQEFKYNKKVTAKLTSLEKQHEELQQQVKIIEKTTKPNIQEQTRQRLNSESKIDLLLMGHKTDDTLSADELAKISQVHDIAEPEQPQPILKKPETPQISKDISAVFNSLTNKQDEDGEGDSDLQPIEPIAA